MAKYRKISPRLWNDAKVRELSDKGKLAFLFLLTHPAMTPFGAIRANVPGLAFELGRSAKTFARALKEIIDAGMAAQDQTATLIWFPNFLKYNRPESPNVIKSWAGAFDDLPECSLRDRIHEALDNLAQRLGKAFYEAFSEAFADVCQEDLTEGFQEGLPEPLQEGFTEGFAHPSPNQEQEQEQEQEQDLNSEESAEASPAPLMLPVQCEEPDPVFISLPVVGSAKEKEVSIPESEVAYFQELYPGVDVRQQLRSMRGWLDAHPSRRKTASGIRRFVTGWLAREQNKGRQAPQSEQARPAPSAAQKSWENYQKFKATQEAV